MTPIQPIENSFEYYPAGRAPCAGGGHFVTGIGLRAVLPVVAIEFLADQREAHAKQEKGVRTPLPDGRPARAAVTS